MDPRYEYYLDTIPITYLAPFSDRWTQNIQHRTAVTIDGRDEVPELMEQMWQERKDQLMMYYVESWQIDGNLK